MGNRVVSEMEWVVDDQGSLIGVKKRNNSVQSLATLQTDSNGNVVGLLGPGGEELSQNALFGNKAIGAQIFDWDACTIGTPTAGYTVEKSTDHTIGGKKTLKISATAGAATTGTCEITFPAATFFGGAKRKGFHALINDSAVEAYANTALQLWLYYTTGTYGPHRMSAWAYPNQGVGDWLQGYVFDQDDTSMQHLTIAPDWATLEAETSVKLQLVLTKGAGVAIGPIYITPIIADPIADPVATLTIFMDGQYNGQYDYARKVLGSHGFRTSMSIIPAWLNDYPTPGAGAFPNTMTEAKMLEMYNLGHEFIHHTGRCGPTGHVNVGWDDTSKYPDGQEYALVKDDIEYSQNWMTARGATRGLGYGVVGFTTGLDDAQTLARRTNITNAVRDAGMKKMRQLGTYYESYYGNCGLPTLFPPQTTMVQDATSEATITGIVDKIIARGGWGGLTFHNVYLGSTTGANDVDVAKFKAVMAYIQTKVAAGVLRVLPFSEAMKQFDTVREPV